MPYNFLFDALARNWIWKLPSGEGRIALTFDDGPDEETTSMLLNTLHQLRMPATFFLNGQKCIGNENLLWQMQQDKHELANHGFNHKSHFYFNSEKQRASISQTHELLFSYHSNPVRLFRPPFGIFNLKTKYVLQSLSYCGVLWSVMIGDWKNEKTAVLWSRLKKKIFDGAIIVLHDGHSTTKNLVPLLYLLAEEAEQRNWKFVRLNDEIQKMKRHSINLDFLAHEVIWKPK